MHSYELFGIRLDSDIPLHWLGPVRLNGDGVDLTLRCRERAAMPTGSDEGEPVYHSPWVFDGAPLISILRTPRGNVVRYVDGETYLLEADEITVYTTEGGPYVLLQSRLLSVVMSYWMELRGVVMLHASAAKLGAGAVAFAADSGTGKSTIAAHLTASGVELLSDDMLACSVSAAGATAWPSFPSLRLWPHQAQYFFGSTNGMEVATPLETKLRLNVGLGGYGRFCATAQPLLGVCILQRVDDVADDVEIQLLHIADAVRSLTQYSFVRRLVSASGMTATRFGVIAGLVERVPVYRLVYRSCVEILPHVIAEITSRMAVGAR